MTKESADTFEVQLVHKDAACPQIATGGSAGYDLFAVEAGRIEPGERQRIAMGIKMKIPAGHCGKICGRSGLAFKHGIQVLGGVIDSDYRGELWVILHNTDGKSAFEYGRGDRIAQMVIHSVYTQPAVSAAGVGEAGRPEGFGSTGR